MKHSLKLYLAMGAFVATMAMLVLLVDHSLTMGQWLMTGIATVGGCVISGTELSEWMEEENKAYSHWGEQLDDRCE